MKRARLQPSTSLLEAVVEEASDVVLAKVQVLAKIACCQFTDCLFL